MPVDQDVTRIRVRLLEEMINRDQVWSRMADKYGVENPSPPWKSSLDGVCDALDREGTALPLLARREEEDRLTGEVYPALPFPENQLVALAHSLIARKVIDEDELAEHIAEVRARLEADGVTRPSS
ncbi:MULTISPECIES: thiocyanate hydrolase [Nocardia]|uniref:thiocyanate hydrolase n=1 Tax=Nocardia TaxID=1817 RepID=UPI00189608CB|nr:MULTISPECIES: thiocyanate hydrolase [Nocardia]MBF6349121.1 thiocyanate hydrolase [Nocardia flavorosea]